MFCPKCGTSNEDSAKFCATCGAPLKKSAAAEATSHSGANQPAPKNTTSLIARPRTKLIAGAAAVMIIVAVAVAAVLIFGGSKLPQGKIMFGASTFEFDGDNFRVVEYATNEDEEDEVSIAGTLKEDDTSEDGTVWVISDPQGQFVDDYVADGSDNSVRLAVPEGAKDQKPEGSWIVTYPMEIMDKTIQANSVFQFEDDGTCYIGVVYGTDLIDNPMSVEEMMELETAPRWMPDFEFDAVYQNGFDGTWEATEDGGYTVTLDTSSIPGYSDEVSVDITFDLN